MKTRDTIIKNTYILLIAQIISIIFGFIYIMYSTRYLGAKVFGVLSFSLAFTGIFGVLADLGLNTLTVRNISRSKEAVNAFFGNILIMKVILSLLTIVVIAFLIYILGFNGEIVCVLYICTFSVILSSIVTSFYALFEAYQKLQFQSLGLIVNNSIMILFALLVIKLGYNVTAFALIYLLDNTLLLIYCLAILKLYFFTPVFSRDIHYGLQLIKKAIPFGINSIAINVYLYVVLIFLFLFEGEESIGFFNAAYNLILVLIFVPTVCNSSIFPVMCRYYVSDNRKLNNIFEKFFKIMSFISIPLGVGTTIIAYQIINIIYGKSFIASAIILQILIWALVLIFMRNPFERLLEATNHQVAVTKIFIVSIGFIIIANLIFIPQYGYIGAAIITVATNVIILVVEGIVVYRTGYTISMSELINLLKIMIACCIMGIFEFYLRGFGIFVQVGISISIYLILSYILGIVSKDDIFTLTSIIKSRNNVE